MGRDSAYRERVAKEREAVMDKIMKGEIKVYWKGDKTGDPSTFLVNKWIPDSQGRMLLLNMTDVDGQMLLGIPFENIHYFTQRDVTDSGTH